MGGIVDAVSLVEVIVFLLILGGVYATFKDPKRSAGVIGLTAGLLIGWLTRPSIPLLGQLPFETVVTRGAILTGLDHALLKGAAERSFNHMALLGLAGAIAGAASGWYLRQKASEEGRQGPAAPSSLPSNKEGAVIAATFCTACGTGMSSEALFCSNCGTQKSASV